MENEIKILKLALKGMLITFALVLGLMSFMFMKMQHEMRVMENETQKQMQIIYSDIRDINAAINATNTTFQILREEINE